MMECQCGFPLKSVQSDGADKFKPLTTLLENESVVYM